MHAIVFDPTQNFLKVRMIGFWEPDHAQRFVKEFKDNVDRYCRDGANFAIVIDFREFATQSSAVMEIFGEAVAHITAQSSYPVACIHKSVLSKMQGERAFPYANIKVFLQEDDAQRWIGEWRAAQK